MTIYQGHVLDVLRQMPVESARCAMASPTLTDEARVGDRDSILMQMYMSNTTGYDRVRTVHLYRTCQTLRRKPKVDAVEVRYPQEVDPRQPGGPVWRICAYCQARREGRILRTLSREAMEST